VQAFVGSAAPLKSCSSRTSGFVQVGRAVIGRQEGWGKRGIAKSVLLLRQARDIIHMERVSSFEERGDPMF